MTRAEALRIICDASGVRYHEKVNVPVAIRAAFTLGVSDEQRLLEAIGVLTGCPLDEFVDCR